MVSCRPRAGYFTGDPSYVLSIVFFQQALRKHRFPRLVITIKPPPLAQATMLYSFAGVQFLFQLSTTSRTFPILFRASLCCLHDSQSFRLCHFSLQFEKEAVRFELTTVSPVTVFRTGGISLSPTPPHTIRNNVTYSLQFQKL